jgi:hypothetical protein
MRMLYLEVVWSARRLPAGWCSGCNGNSNGVTGLVIVRLGYGFKGLDEVTRTSVRCAHDENQEWGELRAFACFAGKASLALPPRNDSRFYFWTDERRNPSTAALSDTLRQQRWWSSLKVNRRRVGFGSCAQRRLLLGMS